MFCFFIVLNALSDGLKIDYLKFTYKCTDASRERLTNILLFYTITKRYLF